MTTSSPLPPFVRSLWITVSLFVLLALAFALYVYSEKLIDKANEQRYTALLIAEELRQTSDDLTHMVRTYIVTGDSRYKKQFQDVLAIRNSKLPGAKNYSGTYWNWLLNDKPPQSDSHPAITLAELMYGVSFTDAELQKLAIAKAKSDELTATEFEVMKLSEATGAEAESNRAKARLMIYNDDYQLAKTNIMKAIADFFSLIDERTHHSIHKAENNALIFRYVFIAFAFGSLFALWRNYVWLQLIMGDTVDKVQTQIARIGSGDFSNVIPIDQGKENSVLGWLSATQKHLSELDRLRQISETKLRHQLNLYAALSQCNQALVHCTNEADLFNVICRDVVSIGGMKMAWIGITDTKTQKVQPVASFGAGLDYLQNLNISVDASSPYGRGPTGTAVREDKAFWCQDFVNASVTAPWHEHAKTFGWHSSASLPLHKNGVAIGALTLYSDTLHAFDEPTCDLLLEMATDISFALDNFERENARQLAEQALKHSLARTQLLLDSSLDAIVSIDQHGNVVGWSHQAQQLFGYAPEQVMGRDLCQLIVPTKYHDAHQKGLERFLQTGASTFIGKHIETEAMRVDGTLFPVELTIAALAQPGAYFFNAYIRDITERKQVEAELHIAATAFESQEGMIITAANQRILKVNQAFTRITGYSSDEAIGKTPAMLKSGRHNEMFYQQMWQNLKETRHWQGEIWNRRKNGEVYPEWMNISAVTDAAGKVLNYVAAFADISQHKQANKFVLLHIQGRFFQQDPCYIGKPPLLTESLCRLMDIAV